MAKVGRPRKEQSVPKAEEQKTKKVGKNFKARHWCFVAYPDSVPPDWLEWIKLSGLRCAVSPLHDKDNHSDPAVPDSKKPHWHVIISWENGSTTYSVASEFTASLNASIPQKLESPKGYYRYFTHMDDPDKFQYDPTEIILIGGFNVADFSEMSRGDRVRFMAEVQKFIRDHNIHEYAELLDLLMDNHLHEQWEVAISNTLAFRAYITSRRHLAGGRKAESDE